MAERASLELVKTNVRDLQPCLQMANEDMEEKIRRSLRYKNNEYQCIFRFGIRQEKVVYEA